MQGGSTLCETLQSHMLVKMSVELTHVGNTAHLKEYCDNSRLSRMEMTNMERIWCKERCPSLIWLILMIVIAVVPAVIIALQGTLRPQDHDAVDQEQDLDVDQLGEDMREVKGA